MIFDGFDRSTNHFFQMNEKEPFEGPNVCLSL